MGIVIILINSPLYSNWMSQRLWTLLGYFCLLLSLWHIGLHKAVVWPITGVSLRGSVVIFVHSQRSLREIISTHAKYVGPKGGFLQFLYIRCFFFGDPHWTHQLFLGENWTHHPFPKFQRSLLGDTITRSGKGSDLESSAFEVFLQCELQFLGSFRPERFAAAALRAYLESWDPHLSVVKNGIEQLTFTFGSRTIPPLEPQNWYGNKLSVEWLGWNRLDATTWMIFLRKRRCCSCFRKTFSGDVVPVSGRVHRDCRIQD